MAAQTLPPEALQQALDAFATYGNQAHAAAVLGLNASTFKHRLAQAQAAGMTPATRTPSGADDTNPDTERVRAYIRGHSGATLMEVADGLDLSPRRVRQAIDTLKNSGINLQDFGGRWSLEKAPAPQHAIGALPVYQSRADDTYIFGFTSDNHLCSKYERLDVLEGLYDKFAEIGVDRVFNAGNWIDGEASFNKHDLHTHGMDAQLDYLAKHYPQRPGITTFSIAGDDHEGWYCQREGVDIGAYAAMKMQQAGRKDWINLGYMEAFVRLVNRNTGRDTKLLLCHPGGGSAYAISYTSQKSVEAFEGGEKPAVALFGHYHKLAYFAIRNVHTIQTGCTEDQTPFMRKKKLAAHVGGGVVRLTQDRESGAITACAVEFYQYFNREFYNDRWSKSGAVNAPPRALP